MKRRDFLAFLFFLLAFLFPGICLASKLLDYTLLVHSGRHFAVLSTLLYGILGILLLHREEKTAGAVSAVLLSLCPFLNQINVLLAIFYTEDFLVVFLFIPWTVLSVVIVSEYVERKLLKVPFYVLAGFLTLPILLFLPFIGFGARTTLACELSPDAVYCAEVIDDDQGALGGSTRLVVYRFDKSFCIGSFEFRKSQKELRSGPWGEFDSLAWQDRERLSMNGKTYEIADFFPENLSEKERIIRYVRKHEGLLLRYIAKNDAAIVEKQAIIRQIRRNDAYIEFCCGTSGVLPQDSVWGLYYSESDDLLALCPPSFSERELLVSGNGYLRKESWEDPRSDNSYYVEPILDHFYYYEIHF